jgi:DNA topoisomerase VI subunit A
MEEIPCVKDDKKSMYECMKDEVASEDCKAVRNAYYMCKHSQLNMRTRIRGTRTY